MTDLLPPTRAGNLVVWAVLWSALLGWQIVSVVVPALPSIGDVVRAIRRRWLGRWALLAGWASLGWHLFVETTF